VSQRSVRPAHRMVAHTGFITTARRCLPRGVPISESADDEEGEDVANKVSEG
jgi:hypothetical protein